MAEEILKYKVEIDSSDVAEQLQSIRNQVDLAMGSLAAQQVKPTTFDRVSQTFETANIGGVADAFRQKFERDTQSTMSTMGQMLDKTAERMQMGYSRFTADARRLGLLSPAGLPEVSTALPQVGPGAGMGFFRGLAATQGFGFDPTGSMTGQEFAEAGGAAVTRGFENFASSAGVTSLGAAIGGLAGGPMGAIGGAMVGGTVDMALGAITSQARGIQDFAGGLAAIGGQNLVGGTSRDFYQAVAENTFARTRSLAGRQMGLTMDEIGNQISDFGNAGGFRGMDAGEFAATVSQLPSAVRNLAQGANIGQQDASALMGSMVNMGLADNVLNASSQALLTNALGNATGLGLNGMMGAGMAGVNMTAGMGMNPGNAFGLAQQITGMTAQSVLAGDPASTAFANIQGGAQQAGLATFEQGVRSLMSPVGMAFAANIMGGGSQAANLSEAMSGAASFFSQDPGNVFSAMANQGLVVGQMNPLTVQNFGVQSAVDMLQGMGFTNSQGQVNPNQLAGLMMSLDPSLSPEQARHNVSLAMQGPDAFIRQNLMAHMEATRDLDMAGFVSPMAEFQASVTQPFVNYYDDTIGALGGSLMSSWRGATQDVGDWISSTLYGVDIKRNSPVRNANITGMVGRIARGEGLEPSIREGYDASNVSVNAATYNQAVDQGERYIERELSSSEQKAFFALDDAKEQIFHIVTRGKSDTARDSLFNYIMNEEEAGRSYTAGDIMTMARSASQFATTRDLKGKDKQWTQSGVDSARQVIKDSIGWGDESTRNAFIADFEGQSEAAVLERLVKGAGIEDADGNIISDFSALPQDYQMAVWNTFQDVRGARNTLHGINTLDLDPSLGSLSPKMSKDEAIEWEAKNYEKQQVLQVRDSAEFKGLIATAEQNIRDDITENGSRFTQSDLTALGEVLGRKVTQDDLIKAVTGQDSSIGDFESAWLRIEQSGNTALSKKLRQFRDSALDLGMNESLDIGKGTYNLTQIANMGMAYDISEDVLNTINEISADLAPEIRGNKQVMDVIADIATQERVSGVPEKTINKNIRDKIDKLTKIHQIKQKDDLSAELESLMTADVLIGADKLKESIEYNKMFDKMDTSLQTAAKEGMQLEFFITGAEVNKKLRDAFTASLTVAPKQYLHVKSH